MRTLATLAVFLAGCERLDISQPIALVSHGLTDEDRANFEEAASCWNLQYGTQFVVGEAPQQVEAFYDKQTCLHAVAQVQAGWPTKLAICPQQYWPGLLPENAPPITPFRVISHELGHVLNITGHPKDTFAVMLGGSREFEPMFSRVDTEMLLDANPEFTPSSPCRRLIRMPRPGSGGRVGHCACEIEYALDLARPIAISIDPEVSPSFATAIGNAAQCWNLRYGLSLELRSPVAGDQVVHVEPKHRYCSYYRVRDRDDVHLCTPADYENHPLLDSAMNLVATIFGVASNGEGLFPPSTDEDFAKWYPNQPIACPNVTATDGACSCAP